MANTLNISNANLIGGQSFVESTFTIINGEETFSEKHYFFSANQFSAIYDIYNPNIGVLNLGKSHSITISNGDFDVLMLSGTVYENVSLLIQAYINNIANYTT